MTTNQRYSSFASSRNSFSLLVRPKELGSSTTSNLRKISHLFIQLIMPATTAETLSLVTRTVSVAPLVLLSAADHYGRSAKGTRKRVVGVLLGQNDGKDVRVSNSFAGEIICYFVECRNQKLTK